MNIHIFQHVHFEEPGYIVEWAVGHSYRITVTRFYESEFQFPQLDSIDALIIMGGPMNVYGERKFPWLVVEKDFITTCIRAEKKIIGICLGAQLAALCLGASISKAGNKEIGWYPVGPTSNCERFPWFHNLFKKNPRVLHWHSDKFDIPSGAVELLRSPANTNQAFIFNKQVLGLQFHLESTLQSVSQLLQYCKNDIQTGRFIQLPGDILTGTINNESNQGIMAEILNQFLLKPYLDGKDF